MILKPIKPRIALNKAFLKVKPGRQDIEKFKDGLSSLLASINEVESEEHHKNLVIEFLKNTYYAPAYFVNTKGRTDLVIHNGKEASTQVGVLVEVKKPSNRSEFVKQDNLNTKAFQELVLYFLRERLTHNNLEIKHLAITNIYEWFVFDVSVFEKYFAQNKQLVKQFQDFEGGRLSGNTTDFFYKEIAAPAIGAIQAEISFTHFDIRHYEKLLKSVSKEEDKKLIALFKLLSPQHLLKEKFTNDSNSLDKSFYAELLHIIGLTESKEGNKKIIERKKAGERDNASLLENCISYIDSRGMLSELDKPLLFGENYEERLFNVGLELTITWVNRILFLKLLEAQLINYHKGDKKYSFLNYDRIRNYDDLDSLFFNVLAKKPDERDAEVNKLFKLVPYLNSSLFEGTDLEKKVMFIGNLQDERKLPVFSGTVLKDGKGKKKSGSLSTIEYIFEFLNAYDFSSEGGEDIQEDNKRLINASVLGLIFEKINGYKDGSFFTPGFITMYMCRETIRRAVVQKFNERKGWNCKDFDELDEDLKKFIIHHPSGRGEARKEANEIINSLKICDPAVGSGHFLVSALNEIIAIKHELDILSDKSFKPLTGYKVEVINDELVVTKILTDDETPFEYLATDPESQRVQETLFHEKQTIIENCLFGVDINPNSVKICRLRLWIELLKNAYYKKDGELETLPNIDINIKCGNSLISRFPLDADLSKALKSIKYDITAYRGFVKDYQHATSKEEKRGFEKLLEQIKNDFRIEITSKDPKQLKLNRLNGELFTLLNQQQMFELSRTEQKARKQKKEKLEKEITKLATEIEEIKSNRIYENAFEWRFEFPEVLDDEGNFVGFDVVIGNPPYFSMSKLKEQADYFSNASFETYSKGADIYCLFYELGGKILRGQGLLTYITSNSWLRAIYGKLLKDYFLKSLQPISLLNIEDIQIFEEATVESSIITLQKRKLTDSFAVVNLSKDYTIGASLSHYFALNNFDFIVPETSEWFIGNKTEGNLKAKIEIHGKQLKEFDVRINFGIKTGYNEAFIIDEQTKDELIRLDDSNAEIIKPILRGRDLKKYNYEFSALWVLCTFPSLKIDIENYPIVKGHFLKIGKKRLDQSGELGSRKKTNNKWFETQDSISYWKDFEKPKIVWGEISDKPKFAFDDEGYYAEATTFLMTGEKLKFLLAILNSKVSKWYFNLIGTTTGMGTNRWKKYKIELLPIKEPSEEQEKEIENFVNEIISIKKQNPTSDTTELENQIDQLVYELYGLTEEEIKIVEGEEK